MVGEHRHLDTEQRCPDRGAEQRPVALVVGMGDQRHAGGHQLGPGRLDPDALAEPLGPLLGRERETEPVEGAGPLPVLQLGLGDGRTEGDVPQGGRLRHVGLAAGQVAQERALGGGARTAVDGGVGQRPVHRQAQAAPQLLERLLVLDGEPLAQLDEVAARDRHLPLGVGPVRRLEPRVVGDGGVAAHAEVVLHPALGGQAVVVPAHRVEDLAAAHPLETGDRVGVGVGEDVTDVQGTGDGRRRGVYRVDLLAGARPVEAVGALGLPAGYTYGFQPVESRLLGHGRMARSLLCHASLWYGFTPYRAGED